MKVLVLHNAPEEQASKESLDVLAQRDAVLSALRALGIQSRSLACDLDLEAVRREVEAYRPNVVFNLVESLAGTDRLMSLVPLLLDGLGVPYTGARPAAILATGNKVAAKAQLRHAALPTPDWCTTHDEAAPRLRTRTGWIIKPVWEHASRGMADDSVFVPRDGHDLLDRLMLAERRTGHPMLAERYVEGREFNLSLLGGDVLPAAEIDFSAFPPGKPRIVGYAAKWDELSFEYRQTPRRFEFPPTDARLLETLCGLARCCWKLFGLTGFARVDFRVDERDQPWILEVNANPCLSPDAGFAAALSAAGIPFHEAIGQLLDEASSLRSEPAHLP